MTITYTSALVSNVAGVESAIVQGSTARAGGFCDLYGVCDDLLANR